MRQSVGTFSELKNDRNEVEKMTRKSIPEKYNKLNQDQAPQHQEEKMSEMEKATTQDSKRPALAPRN